MWKMFRTPDCIDFKMTAGFESKKKLFFWKVAKAIVD